MLLIGVGAGRIEHRVPSRRRDLKWLASLLLRKFIAAHAVKLPQDRGERSRRTGKPARRRRRSVF